MPTLTIPQALQAALHHHQAGRLAEADALYRQILAADPCHADALHLLGVLAHSMGCSSLAVECIRQAIAVSPSIAAYHSNLGSVLCDAGQNEAAIIACRQAIKLAPAYAQAHCHLANALRNADSLTEAEEAYREALRLNPKHDGAQNNLGILLLGQGRLDEAIAAFRSATESNPGNADAHSNLGNALYERGDGSAAIAACRAALVIRPDHAVAACNLGNALRKERQFDGAIAAYRRALQSKPDYVAAQNNLGVVLYEHGQSHAAITECRRAVQLSPDFAEAHFNLGNALADMGRTAEALAEYGRAIELRPDYPEAYYNLGYVLRYLNRFDEAEATYRHVLKLRPGYADARTNLGNVIKDQARLDEALECYRQAIELKPGASLLQSNLLYAALFHPWFDPAALRREQQRWGARHAEPLRQSILPHANIPDAARRLKVGYLSPDFTRHVICHFLIPLLEAHDHEKFEIYCYSSVKRSDAITERLKKSADVWRDVLAMKDEALAQQIREDGIDILVDLTQHMADNRLPVFARKPAPVQVAWLGYPGSTGLTTIDYRITDAFMEPEGATWSESVETPVRLPDSWFCFDPIDEFPLSNELPALCAGHLTFCCLNNFCKVSDPVLHRWAAVMKAVEGSRLVLQCPTGETQARVSRFFESQGIAPARLELFAWLPTRAEFLKLFERVDVALDPFPYNGGTTTCEALWMGIPVLTLPGETIVSRIGLSILSACGMTEFVADSEEAYVRLAQDLAGDFPRLARLRSTLRERMKASHFMDAPRFARNMEAAYRQMWRAWCAGQPAKP